MAEQAGRVIDRAPNRIQFFKAAPFNRDATGPAIKSTETKNIEEIIYIPQSNRDRRTRKKIFYKVEHKRIR